MGRNVLIAAALAVVTACATDSAPPQEARVADADPHAALACAGCHQGKPPEGPGLGQVPRASCTTAGCHPDGGPAVVRLASVEFRHRSHADTAQIQPACASCHGHAGGGAPLAASVDACALCHAGQLDGREPHSCQACHPAPTHVTRTSQQVVVPHARLPWVETGCVRCHFDVARPPTRVSSARCAACHGPAAGVVQAGLGADLHPSHQGAGCASCHGGGMHRVQAMSSAVVLVCADCHAQAHETRVDASASAVCAGCHGSVHAEQQRLLLGLVDGAPAMPSAKFMTGMTCRSCHTRPEAAVRAAAADPVRGRAASCEGCHRGEYRVVLQWWLEGLRERERVSAGYLRRATAELGGVAPDDVTRVLARADGMLEAVRTAGGQHNLELSDWVFRESVASVRRAYRLAGRTPPPAPELGNRPHVGFCSYCHYSPADPWQYDAMPADFHREVVGARDTAH